MKSVPVFCYYEGYNSVGQIVCNGNHTCNIDYTGYLDACEYVTNTTKYLLDNVKKDQPSLSRIVIKNVTIFPSE